MQKRIEWLDSAKAIGIILVIIGHIPFRPNALNVWLGSFHMPLFFFLAGITYNADKYAELHVLVKSKVRSLIIPYFLFAGITFCWKIVLGLKAASWQINTLALKPLVKYFIGIFIQIRRTPYGIGVWFIPCIFIAFILLNRIMWLEKHYKIHPAVSAVFCLLLGYIYAQTINIPLPWGIDAAFVAVFFMYLGCSAKRYLIDKKCVGGVPGVGILDRSCGKHWCCICQL